MQLEDGKISIEDFLMQHCAENNAAVDWALREMHLGDGGSPSIVSYEIENVEFDKDSLKGGFNFEYVVDYYFGCDGQNNIQQFENTCEFEIDRANHLLILEFEEMPERDPDFY